LLEQDGWDIELGPGIKDGGVDILARKYDRVYGKIMTIWQAKKLERGNKVGISTIRELADTRNELKASKGIIVTSSYLTRGAIERIVRDEYLLGKVDGDDLRNWIACYRK